MRITDINPNSNDYYWIGLSYNRTAAGKVLFSDMVYEGCIRNADLDVGGRFPGFDGDRL